MNFQHLISFLTVSKTLNLRKAAEELYLTQPALSAQIRKLEEELGVILFERSYQGLTLTPAGEILIYYATEILNRLNECKGELADLEKEPQGNVVLGSTTSIVLTIIPRILAYFQDQYPKVKVIVETEEPENMINRLLRNELNLVVMYGDHQNKLIKRQTIYYEQFVIITSLDDKREGMSHGDFQEHPFILPRVGTMERSILNDYFDKMEITPNVRLEVTSSEEIKRMVERKIGYGIIPKSTFRPGVDQIKLLTQPHYILEVPVSIYTKHQGYQSLAVRKLIEDMTSIQVDSVFDT